MKLTKMVYLASPYSAIGKTRVFMQTMRYEAVTKLAALLIEEYNYAFILPITMSHHTAQFLSGKSTGFKDWAKIDFTYLSRCDELWVYMLDGWKKSIGVQAEIRFAKRHKIPIKYIEYNQENQSHLLHWKESKDHQITEIIEL